jgi:hypothetical protein
MIFYKNILNKTNGQTYLKKSTTSTIKIQKEYNTTHYRFKLLSLLTLCATFDQNINFRCTKL